MSGNSWTWKSKDGAHSRLLYEPGNWGDLIKLLWVSTILHWQIEVFGRDAIEYLDPFAGAPEYQAGRRTKFRFEQAGLVALEFIREQYVARERWPSAASAAALLLSDPMRQASVFDSDPERRKAYIDGENFTVWESDSGWTVLEAASTEPTGLILIDPYDFLSDWRRRLPRLIAKAEETSVLVYLYNRSPRSKEDFREYRDFRNNLDDLRGAAVKRIARVAGDSFLPRSYHEMVFLPSPSVTNHPRFDELLHELERGACQLADAVRRAETIDC